MNGDGDAVNVAPLGHPMAVVSIRECLIDGVAVYSVMESGREVYWGTNEERAREFFHWLTGRDARD